MGKNNLKHRRRNHHNSFKSGLVYCDSSYEMKAALILDADPEVVRYSSHLGFFNKDGKRRFVDFLVEYRDGTKRIIEIKPFRRLDEYSSQIEDNQSHARENGWGFDVWTESNLGFKNEYDATRWADHYLSTINKMDYVEARKELNREKAKRHYEAKIAQDKVTVFCDYCQIEHEALRLTYEKNVARNGRYICEREGGKIAGSRPKKKKINPFAADGKKQCTKCQEVLDLNCFGDDKSRSDGKSSRCRECRSVVSIPNV